MKKGKCPDDNPDTPQTEGNCYYSPSVDLGMTPDLVDKNGNNQGRAGALAILDATRF